MTINADAIERAIQASLPEASIKVKDLRGDGAYFTAMVISSGFKDMRILDQHRMVYKALAGTLGDSNTHLLQLTTRAA